MMVLFLCLLSLNVFATQKYLSLLALENDVQRANKRINIEQRPHACDQNQYERHLRRSNLFHNRIRLIAVLTAISATILYAYPPGENIEVCTDPLVISYRDIRFLRAIVGGT